MYNIQLCSYLHFVNVNNLIDDFFYFTTSHLTVGYRIDKSTKHKEIYSSSVKPVAEIRKLSIRYGDPTEVDVEYGKKAGSPDRLDLMFT